MEKKPQILTGTSGYSYHEQAGTGTQRYKRMGLFSVLFRAFPYCGT
jgi:hypothetical protein